MRNTPYADEAPVRRVMLLLIVFLATIGIVLAVIFGLSRFWGISGDEAMPGNPHQGVPPSLETAPQPALRDYLTRKQRIANGYAWVDPERQLIHIPIEEAMRAITAPSSQPRETRASYLMGAGMAAPPGGKEGP